MVAVYISLKTFDRSFLKFNPEVQYMTEQEIRDIFSIVEDSER